MRVSLVNGRVEVREENGALSHLVGYSNAKHVCVHPSGKILFILSEKGKLEVWNIAGTTVLEIVSCAVKSAEWSNEGIEYLTIGNERKCWNWETYWINQINQ